MNIEKLINELGRNIAKTVLHKKDDSNEIITLSDDDSEIFLGIILKGLVYRKEYNKAENILFEQIKKNKSQQNYKIALDFYQLLLKKSDKELEEGTFSKEEIFQGLNDIEILFQYK